MRFMVQVRADKKTEAGVMPSEKMLTDMGKYNEELMKAGVLLAGEGLHFSGGKPTVIEPPFADPRELIAGFWMFKVKSKAEAIEWIKRCPMESGAELAPELREAEQRMRAQIERSKG